MESQQSDFSTQGWIIGTMCAVALLTLIVLMVFFVIQRNKGGKYAGTLPPPQRQDMFAMEKGQLTFEGGLILLLFCFRRLIKIQEK